MSDEEKAHCVRGEMDREEPAVTAEPQSDTATELASIKTMLQVIAKDISEIKGSHDSLQTTAQQNRGRITETETSISMLVQKCNTRDGSVTQVQKTVTYLKEERRCNGVMDNSEMGDMDVYVCTLLKEGLGLDMN
ncbi:unnamed protein product [Pleuronectes platessa]|uniref:Uncharacterized protein n=1 Tax=Pleuronectes platessa TaxID=8262 RepID=A0A9N7U3U9_PLEPL|nr:unnamed protein product [Pleuronectes platessa]